MTAELSLEGQVGSRLVGREGESGQVREQPSSPGTEICERQGPGTCSVCFCGLPELSYHPHCLSPVSTMLSPPCLLRLSRTVTCSVSLS